MIIPSISISTLTLTSSTSCSAPHREPNTMFDIQYVDRRVALKASNGKFVCTKKNGQLAAVSDAVGE